MASPREPSTLRGGRGVEATVLRPMTENSDFLLHHQKDPRFPKSTPEGPKSQRRKRLA